MAVPVEVTLLSRYAFIFIVILVYAVVYGALKVSKVFGSEAVNHLIAITLAIIVLFVPGLIDVIKYFGTWIVVLLLVAMMAILLIRFMGASEEDVKNIITGNKIITYWIVAIFVIVLLAALGKVYFAGLEDGEEGPGEIITEGKGPGEIRFWETFFHPNVMGFILIMLIAVFAILALSGKAK